MRNVSIERNPQGQGWRGLILIRFFFLFKYLTQKKNVFCFFLLIFVSMSGQAAVIQFPDQELASEYVFPVFKLPKAVMNRHVTLSHRFEFRLAGAFRTDEPFYSPFSALSSLSFYWNESHGIGVSGLFFFPGLSGTGNTLKTGVTIKQTEKIDSYFDVRLAPHPFLAAFLHYQFSPLYGKISLTKSLVFNFALYSFFGMGAMGLQHGAQPIQMIPATHFGIGQKFYFNRYFALDGGIDFLLYRGFNPVSREIQWKPGQPAPARPPYSKFKSDIFIRFLVRVGVAVLI